MKHIIILFFFISTLVFSCAVQKNEAGYEFPPQMTEATKTQFKEASEKGRILYGINCAQCHNRKIKGRETIPDFLPEQIKGYEIRVANAQHEENMPDEKVSAEELGLIAVFLTYKKKSGVAIK